MPPDLLLAVIDKVARLYLFGHGFDAGMCSQGYSRQPGLNAGAFFNVLMGSAKR